jgi:hypothetical protein
MSAWAKSGHSFYGPGVGRRYLASAARAAPFPKSLYIFRCEYWTFQRDRQLIELPRKLKWHFVVAIVDRRAGVSADIERFIELQDDRDRTFHLLARHHFAVDLERSGTAAKPPPPPAPRKTLQQLNEVRKRT